MIKKLFKLIIILIISSNNINAQNKNKQKNEILELNGSITVENKTNFEVSDCIANSAMIMGVSSYTKSEKDASESSFVHGNYSYSYFVNDYSSEAGKINFKYSYIIKDGKINYKFYDFKHNGNKTKFKSIGLLSTSWNEEIAKTFTEDQYYEIMIDLITNTSNLIKMIKETCL